MIKLKKTDGNLKRERKKEARKKEMYLLILLAI